MFFDSNASNSSVYSNSTVGLSMSTATSTTDTTDSLLLKEGKKKETKSKAASQVKKNKKEIMKTIEENPAEETEPLKKAKKTTKTTKIDRQDKKEDKMGNQKENVFEKSDKKSNKDKVLLEDLPEILEPVDPPEPILRTTPEQDKIEEFIQNTTETIKQLIENEKEGQGQGQGYLSEAESELLAHLGEYIEEPFNIIESYFGSHHLERLVRHQIESFNHFINYQIQRTIQMFNNIVIHSENDFVKETGQYFLEINLSFDNFKLYPPQIHENNGATKIMLPQEAKLRNFTYASSMAVDIQIQYIIRNTETMDTPKIIHKTLPKINIGKMPIMVKSSICVLTQNKYTRQTYTGECPMDCGGYFIVKGSEKTVLGQERAAENRVYCFDGKNTTKWNWFAEIKSVPDYKCISPKQIEMMIASKNNGFGHGIYMTIPRLKTPVELFIVFRALGIISDKDICKRILLDIDDPKYVEILNALQASIIDANKYLTQEEAIEYITNLVVFTPINMDRETGLRKKREFAMDILNNDLFPHCRTTEQKVYIIGYMAKKLIQTSLGWLPPDDRDSYLNKRIELTGTLINNLFRNYFNKLVKEMQKQIIKEINNGSWRSSEDYENIVNMTNIYKIVKSTTIENGIARALATGDFSIKQPNSSKVGVAQVLNRLTYSASLSHLRRINTPLEKSGELIAPRKLHNTTWGFLCPVETPEGQSIGVVKNISYLAHITIPTNSSSLYEYIYPQIKKIEELDPKDMNNKVKVFINGAWVGITEDPITFYEDMKKKKYMGIINIYTSIVFDYKLLEIRICNDGGRLTRPLLKVKKNKVLITQDIISKLVTKEYTWNDLLTNCVLDESVIEYIDPEEQNHSMIAMKSKDHYIHEHSSRMKYTHCEIHPSTIFGVLGSCVPFPEHNQAPRNTYQCAMAKQAVGVYATNYDQRMDKTSYVLTYPSRPLVETRIMNFIQLNKIPSGTQIHVAIMSHTGYNQEDSVLVNKGSIDRGLFSATIYHTEKDEDKNIVRDEIIRCKPDKQKTKGIKFGNYDKLNAHGFIPENTLVENRDVIIAKIIPIKENRNDLTKTIKYEDQSKTFRTTEETYIDKNFTGRNGDGYNLAKVRVRIHRKPVLGDKFCALPTQQVLTEQGWVEIQHIQKDIHRVCTLDSNGNLSYEYPSATFEYDHDDDMYSIENKNIKIICTLNHKLYVNTNHHHPYQLVEAGKVMGNTVRLQKTMKNVNENIETIQIMDSYYTMEHWLIFLGLFIVNGYIQEDFQDIVFPILFQSTFESLTTALNEMKIIYSYNHTKLTISGKTYMELYLYLVHLDKSSLPDYVWKLSNIQCRFLLDALTYNQMQNCVYTNDLNFANDVTRLALHSELSASIQKVKKNNILYKKAYKYQIQIDENTQPLINCHQDKTNVEKLVHYTGKVYCIEMPSSHVYYMRETTYSPPVIIGNSSRHGQKGTCGNIIPECDMPFTKEGLRPDIIINPHAIPSRMTIAQLKETLLGKVLLELGLFGDGTSFGNMDINTITQELQKLGYESYGNEIMYNGLTGEQLETSIFIGPVFYQRLKHMVNDKQHSRAIGPMVNLTRQPAEGRSRDGGFRVGEMERDVLIAHGMSKFCRERLFDVSDKYSVHVCKKCGMIAAYNDGDVKSIINGKNYIVHLCRTCDNRTDFAKVELPYAYKLLSQELQTINVVPRIITEN
jgi:DNA-directed RNA polymerase II subunit RPB2